jgi:large subunit ribosomal protein L19e
MDLFLQKRLAAKVAGVGLDKVVINTARTEEVKEAITKADIRSLIKTGAIIVKPVATPSRFRAKLQIAQKKKGKRRGQGHKKGAWKARVGNTWTAKIRAMRSMLQELRTEKKITNETYRDAYMKAKGGFFRDKGHIRFYLEQNKMVKI